MILTHDEIIKEIETGNIKIEPFAQDQVGPASVDLTLGNYFRKFKKSTVAFPVTEEAEYKAITEGLHIADNEELILGPGETVLAITKEKITLSPNIAGWLEGRSRFARLGLMVHISASFMQPGLENHQALEITNLGGVPLKIKPGLRVCQFVFERCEGEARYEGRFKYQETP